MLRVATLFYYVSGMFYTINMKTDIITLVVIRVPLTKYPTFAARLKFVMTLRNYSAQKLANRLFLSHSAISGYRSGSRMPDSNILCRIAHELRVSTDFLLGMVDYIIEQEYK